MKFLFFYTCFLFAASSCTGVLDFNIKNNTKGEISVSVISSEFQLTQDTFWYEADSTYVLGKFLEYKLDNSRIRFKNCMPEMIMNIKTPDPNKVWYQENDLCFFDLQEMNQGNTLRFSFKLKPGKTIKLMQSVTPYPSFDEIFLNPVDSIIIRKLNMPDSSKIELYGYQAIRAMVIDLDQGSCVLSIN